MLPLVACASPSAEYPSLAIRDAETASEAASAPASAPEAPYGPAVPSEELTARLAQLRNDATKAHQSFVSIEPRARRLVEAANGAGIGSARWAAAQIAVSQLDTQRSLTAVPLADLDMLYAQQAVKLAQRTAIAETQTSILSLITREDQILQDLKGSLAQ